MSRTVAFVGDWEKALKVTGSMAERFKKAAEQAVMKEAHFLRGKMVQMFATGGRAAGKAWAPLAEGTIAIRQFKGFGGTKPLMVTGSLRNSITVIKMGSQVFVGVRRKSEGGKNLADIHEFGREYTMRMTPKMRRFLAAAYAAAGKPFGSGGGGRGSGVIKIRIPARPFVGPVVDMFAKPDAVKKRFWDHVSKAMGYDLGKP